jgi:hypothetical protein
VLTITCTEAQNVYDISQHGRRIQLDGFLLEWKSESEKTFGNNQEWGWNAVNTADGISGYFKSINKVTCRDWIFTFQSQNPGATELMIKINQELSMQKNTFYQLDRALFDSTGVVCVEWVVPWSTAGIGSDGSYKVDIQGASNCGDTLSPIIITGNQNIQQSKSVWSGTAIRIVAIAVLSGAFIFMRRKIRQRKTQKESPHQSTL